MGSSKKVTVGYWYKLLLHFGLCRRPVDALLEFRGGDKAAWRGELTASGSVVVNAANLWGGEEAEGGIDGTLMLMMGEASQEPSALLAAELGPKQSAYRGRCTVVFNGRYGAFNPYPKPAAFRLRRILAGWADDTPWYPEKSVVYPAGGGVSYDNVWKYRVEAPGSSADYSAPGYDDSGWAEGEGAFGSWVPPGSGMTIGTPVSGAVGKSIWIRKVMPGAGTLELTLYHDDGGWLWVDGSPVDLESINYYTSSATVTVSEGSVIAYKVTDGVPAGSSNIFAGIDMEYRFGLAAMNPVHVLYDSLVDPEMKGEPAALINEDSFRAAANRCHAEGLGICTLYDPGAEDIEAFQQRICNVAGAVLSQSRIDGQYYIDLLRGDYDVESLPVLSDADLLEFEEEPAVLTEIVNQVSVEWFDPDQKARRCTAPLQSLGAIESVGGVIAEVISYPEIPYEPLALRLGARDLRSKSTPLKRFSLVANRRAGAWRAGTLFRLQVPLRGIADMVCMVGEIDAGVLRSASVRLIVVQEIFAMPATTYVVDEPGDYQPPDQTPVVAAHQLAFEMPYQDLASILPNAELAALPADAGYLATLAARPATGINYALTTAATGEEFDSAGLFDWCPSATVVEAVPLGATASAVTLASRTDLSRVTVGGAALWGTEIVRVDALDSVAGTATLAHGCADTVPVPHAAGERLWFYDSWAGSDQREYAAGETVDAKLLTRTSSAQLDPSDALTLTLEMAQRAARPYPPAKLRVNGEVEPPSLTGEVTLTWAHRDRVLQADQLVDTEAADVGPEPGTTYTARWYLNGTLMHTDPGIAGTTVAYTPTAGGMLRIELESERDGVASWQMQVREIPVGSPLQMESGELITTEDDQPILME